MIPLLLRLCGYRFSVPQNKELQTFTIAPSQSNKRMYRLWGRFPLLPFIDTLAFSDLSIVLQSTLSFIAFLWAENNPELFLEYTNGISAFGTAAPVFIISWFLFPSVITAVLFEIVFLSMRIFLTPMAFIIDVYQETKPLLQATAPYIEPNSHFFRDADTLPQEIAKAHPHTDPMLPPLAFPEPDFLSPSERTIEGPTFSVLMHGPKPSIAARAREFTPRVQPKAMELDANASSSSFVNVLVELIKRDMAIQAAPIQPPQAPRKVHPEVQPEVQPEVRPEIHPEIQPETEFDVAPNVVNTPQFQPLENISGLMPALPEVQFMNPLDPANEMANLLLQLSDIDFNSWAKLYKALPDNCTTSDYWRMDFSRIVQLALSQIEHTHPIDIRSKQRLIGASAFAEFMVNFIKTNRLLTGKAEHHPQILLDNACTQIPNTHPGYPFIVQLMLGVANSRQTLATPQGAA